MTNTVKKEFKQFKKAYDLFLQTKKEAEIVLLSYNDKGCSYDRSSLRVFFMKLADERNLQPVAAYAIFGDGVLNAVRRTYYGATIEEYFEDLVKNGNLEGIEYIENLFEVMDPETVEIN